MDGNSPFPFRSCCKSWDPTRDCPVSLMHKPQGDPCFDYSALSIDWTSTCGEISGREAHFVLDICRFFFFVPILLYDVWLVFCNITLRTSKVPVCQVSNTGSARGQAGFGSWTGHIRQGSSTNRKNTTPLTSYVLNCSDVSCQLHRAGVSLDANRLAGCRQQPPTDRLETAGTCGAWTSPARR